jgi:hypothetical protein
MDPTAPVSQLVLLLTLVLTLLKICLELFVNALMLVPVPAMLAPKTVMELGYLPTYLPIWVKPLPSSHPLFPHKCLLPTLRYCIKRVSYLLYLIHG